MPISPLDPPKQTVVVEGTAAADVLVYTPGPNYADSFGYEWKRYRRTYVDSVLGSDLSKARIELNLGFPLELLRDMEVLEIGCGAGRFTEHLVKHAKQVTAVDYSEAVFHNAALGAPNLTAIRADVLAMPKFSAGFDLVFCRGVLQHTRDPRLSMKALFQLVRPGGLVIFDVYKKNPGAWRSFKYFFRPIVQRFVPIERFDAYLDKHGERLYDLHHRILRAVNRFGLVRRLVGLTPFYLSVNWENEYGILSKTQRIEIFKNEMIDMLYAHFDQPMTPNEVFATLAEVGQRPYSYDLLRNHFRCERAASMEPIRVRVTKNGVFPIETPA